MTFHPIGGGSAGFGHMMHPLKATPAVGHSSLVQAVMGGSLGTAGTGHPWQNATPKSVNTPYSVMQKKQAPPY